MPEVTVVVPAFNAEKYLAETLASIKAQTVPPKETIVVDDASTDQTAKIAKLHSTFMPLRLVQHEVNCGIGKTRNDGALAAETKFVAFLSSDDCYLPEFLEKSLEHLDDDTATYTAYYRCDERLRVKSTFNPPEYTPESVVDWALQKNMYINFSSVIIPRKIFDVVRFLPNLRHGEDLIFLLDTVDEGLNWQLIAEPLVRYRLHGAQGTFTQKSEEFHVLWQQLRRRLEDLGVSKNVIEESYRKSVNHAFPPFHRRLLAWGYHKIFGYR